MQEYRETCCVNTSRISQIFQNTFHGPNSAPQQVSRRLLKMCSTSRLLMTQNLTDWKDHVESTPCLAVINNLKWKDGFVESRRSVQFWMWLSAIIKDVTELKSWSNLYLATKLALGSGSWMDSTNTWRRCRKRLTLKVLERRVQGTCCEGKTTTDIQFNVVSSVYSVPWPKVDRRGYRNIWSKLSGGIEIDDQISATWWLSKSRGGWSSKIRRSGMNISIKNYVVFALVNSNMAKLLAKRRRCKEEISVLCGSILCWHHLKPSSNSTPFWRYTHFLHCKTTCCYQTTSPSTSLTLEALTTYTLSSSLDWFWVGKWQEREACGVLYSRKSDVRRSAQRNRVQPDESQNCSVQKSLENTPKYIKLW